MGKDSVPLNNMPLLGVRWGLFEREGSSVHMAMAAWRETEQVSHIVGCS